MKILLAAGTALLVLTTIAPFRARASTTPAHEPPAMAVAIAQPVYDIVSGPFSRFPNAEPGLLLLVGSALISVGSLLRRITPEPPQDAGE